MDERSLASAIFATFSHRTKNTTTRAERTHRCRRTRQFGVMCAAQGACIRRRSWADYSINMFKFEFPTGTTLDTWDGCHQSPRLSLRSPHPDWRQNARSAADAPSSPSTAPAMATAKPMAANFAMKLSICVSLPLLALADCAGALKVH
jgi:hypothetical protein